MASLLETITGQLAGGHGPIGQALGTDQTATASAISMALPVLMSALAHNASTPDGAERLHGALADHDGSILGNLAGAITGYRQGPGGAILGHVLGDRQGAVEAGLAQKTGLDAGQIGSLLAMLAPVVLGALGQAQRQQGLDPAGLSTALANEHQTIGQTHPGILDMLGGLLGGGGGGNAVASVLGGLFRK